EHAGAIDQIHERQPILQSDPLGTEDLFAGHRKERAGLYRSIVGDDHHSAAADGADAGDHARRRRTAPFLVHVPGRPEPEFKERSVSVAELRDALAGSEPALRVLALDGLDAATFHEGLFFAAQDFDLRLHA